MLQRWAALGLVASLVALTGCAIAESSAADLPSTTSTSTTTTSTTAPLTTTTSSSTTTTAVPTPALLRSLAATWSKTTAGSCLMVADGPTVLFERNPDAPVTPASVMKLLTATAVLQRIDPSSRLRTPVRALAAPTDGTVVGDLWLVGGGDPVLGTMPYKVHFTRQPRLVNSVENLADRIVAAGVRHVTGRIVGDDGRYTRQRYVPSWPATYISDHETGPLSALSVNDAFAAWSPRQVPFGDPASGAAAVLTDLLRRRGVQVDGAPASGTVPSAAVEVAGIDSPTIAELVGEMLRESDNDTAELLLRELGLRVTGQGTTEAGRQVVVDTLTQLGLPMRGVRIVDGSGLDRGNRVTCRMLTAIFTSAPSRDVLVRSVPVAAQTGTLYKRFLATPVAGHLRAKTGSIKGVASLAGYADNASHRTLTFSYVQNNVGARQGSDLQNELGADLVLAPR